MDIIWPTSPREHIRCKQPCFESVGTSIFQNIHPLGHLFINFPFNHAFTHLKKYKGITYSFTNSLTHSFIYPCIHSFTLYLLFTHTFVSFPTDSLIQSCFDLLCQQINFCNINRHQPIDILYVPQNFSPHSHSLTPRSRHTLRIYRHIMAYSFPMVLFLWSMLLCIFSRLATHSFG